jgi:D-methionine transport system ATP-binding protein
MTLKLQNISLATSINSRYLLQDISFTIDDRDRAVIIGASGAGKTSLLRLLNRLQQPTAGYIYFNSQPIEQVPVVRLRRQVVLVPQEPKLLGMRVWDTLAYPLNLQKLPKQEIQERITSWQAKLHIPQAWLERNELQLSLGQRQLITIARALVMQPKVLLLDEPTSALDAGSAERFIEILIELTQTADTSIVMVNHQLELAQKFATRVLYLQQGQLKENLPVESVNWQQLREYLRQWKEQKTESETLNETDDF